MKQILIVSLALLALVLTQDPLDSSDTDPSDYEPSDEYPSSDASDSYKICWKQSYGRVTYQPLNPCPKGQSLVGAFCYEDCPVGYTANTVSDTSDSPGDILEFSSMPPYHPETFCWQNCPEGMVNYVPEYCAALTPYGNGHAGFSDQASCESKNPQGCEFCSYAWFAKTGCGACSDYCPVTCPSGMIQDEGLCKRSSYNRTAIDELKCVSGLELTDGLCYTPPEKHFSCWGQLCWGACPHGWNGLGALCANYTDVESLSEDVQGLAFDTQSSVQNLADALTDPTKGNTVNVMTVLGKNNLKYPMCH